MELKELREQPVELLPGREALNHFKFVWANVEAYNKAMAVNMFSDHSSATAVALQSISIG
ncbi:hypothetical protein KGA66_04345 [Actinocrinis puniceicyclus]|uniref:Uncharacterized protein n=1 Tax=Actinocrinis puniceicyclus TaxID=977794 RepID=A0A8J7WHF7_9ACTN|nr:hypothetical protein [Actinocrinis puniceicyclus]MBS2962263.1 hypothetical protein [Actinocrinis puniceicyclus]